MTRAAVASRPDGAYATGREKLAGHLAMLAFALLIAGSFSLGSRSAPFIGPAALNSVRFVIGVAIMAGAALFMLRGTGEKLFVIPRAPWRFAVLGGLMAVYFLTMFIALGITRPVSTSAVFTLIPFMSACFGYLFLRQTVGPVVLVSLIVAGAGAVWVIFDGRLDRLMRFSIGPGETVFFFGCLAHAAYAPLVKKFNRGEPVAFFTFWTLAATGLWVVFYGLPEIAATDWTGLPPIAWITIAYLAVFTTAATFFLLQFASLRLPVSKVFGYSYLTPSFIIVIEGLAGAGWASASVAAGALLTVMGLVVLVVAAD